MAINNSAGVWVKATTRMPGLDQEVKWRSDLLEMPDEPCWMEVMLNSYSHVKYHLEWLDESAPAQSEQRLGKEEAYSKKDVVKIINELLERPDLLLDATQNENTNHDAESLFEIATTN